ncbi:MAG: hypothetical protein LBN96_05100 [Desulfovibrio sp.]|nr:hypothetical protein [Desulfovibrio sp.]
MSRLIAVPARFPRRFIIFSGFRHNEFASQERGDFFRQTGPPAVIAKEDWNEKHRLFRKGVEWREGMTEERARIYAEDFDRREWRKELMARGGKQFGFLGGTLPGFFAGMLGSLPDPVNLIPFGGALFRGGSIAASAGRGAFEGAFGNVVVDALVAADLKSRGEELTFADYALDAVFGAALGGAFGAAGGWLGKRAADKKIVADPPASAERPALRHLNVNTMDDVYSLAGQTEERFYSDVEGWADTRIIT